MMKRILIIQVNWIGDILFTTPAIRAIKRHNPDAYIACLILPRCAEMLEANPHVDEMILFDEQGADRGILKKAALVLRLRKKRFDTVISFHRSMSRMLIAYLAGIRRRMGYYTRKRAWLLTDSIEPPRRQPHRVEYFLDIVRQAGIDTKDKDYEFVIPERCSLSADKLLEAKGIAAGEEFFIINPGGNWMPKRWPRAMYAELCRELARAYNSKIVITGAAKDMELTDSIVSMSGIGPVNLCGMTSLKELGAVMKRASLVVSNDSGPMHIAVSQKTPTVAVFGPTSPRITGPYGTGRYKALHKWFDCDIPCYSTCEDYRCMEKVSVGDVLCAIRGLLQEGGGV